MWIPTNFELFLISFHHLIVYKLKNRIFLWTNWITSLRILNYFDKQPQCKYTCGKSVRKRKRAFAFNFAKTFCLCMCVCLWKCFGFHTTLAILNHISHTTKVAFGCHFNALVLFASCILVAPSNTFMEKLNALEVKLTEFHENVLNLLRKSVVRIKEAWIHSALE